MDKRSDRYRQTNELIKDLSSHMAVTTVLSVILYVLSGKISWVLLCVLGGILIDTDHLIDHFRHFGPSFDFNQFIYSHHLDSNKIYLIFHSWEILAVLWLLSIKINILIPVVVGMTPHMLIDQFGSKRKTALFYFIIYRWINNFDLDKLSMDKNDQ